MKNNNLQAVKKILLKDPYFIFDRYSDMTGRLNPITLTVRMDHRQMARILIENLREDSPKKREDKYGSDPRLRNWAIKMKAEVQHILQFAVRYGALGVTKELVTSGLYGYEDLRLDKALIDAIIHGQLYVAQYLIQRSQDVNPRHRDDFAGRGGSRLLEVAVSYGNLDMLQLLINSGVEIDFRDPGHLKRALAGNHTAVAAYLAEKGTPLLVTIENLEDLERLSSISNCNMISFVKRNDLHALIIELGFDGDPGKEFRRCFYNVLAACGYHNLYRKASFKWGLSRDCLQLAKSIGIAIQHGHLDMARNIANDMALLPNTPDNAGWCDAIESLSVYDNGPIFDMLLGSGSMHSRPEYL